MSNQLYSSHQRSSPMFHFQHYKYPQITTFIPMVISFAARLLIHAIFVLLFLIVILVLVVVLFLERVLLLIASLPCPQFQTEIHNYESPFLLYWLQ